jgi:GUCT (NUC152) domain
VVTSISPPVQDVSEDVVPWFMDAARGLLQGGLPGGPEAVVARALAKIAGHTQLRSRSLLTAHEDFTTLQVLQSSCDGRLLTVCQLHSSCQRPLHGSEKQGNVAYRADPAAPFLPQFVGSTQIDRPGFVFGFLRRRGVPEATVEEVSLRTLPHSPLRGSDFDRCSAAALACQTGFVADADLPHR